MGVAFCMLLYQKLLGLCPKFPILSNINIIVIENKLWGYFSFMKNYTHDKFQLNWTKNKISLFKLLHVNREMAIFPPGW